MLSPEIDLHTNPRLRFLEFNLRLDGREIRKSQGDVIRWFNSICESVTSKSLVVEVCDPYYEVKICNKIQDTLLALHERIETFSVYLTPGTKGRGLFSKLYGVGIVFEEDLWLDKNKQVDFGILTSYLLYSSLSFSASPSFPPMRSLLPPPPISHDSQTNVSTDLS